MNIITEDEKRKREGATLRSQSLSLFLKRKRMSQPSHRCGCGKVISGNKSTCAGCAERALMRPISQSESEVGSESGSESL